jgi:hypothetical protein
MFRYLLKSRQFRTTPINLKRVLGIRKLVSVGGRFAPDLDWNQDLFFAYPKENAYAGRLLNLPSTYSQLASFYTSNKGHQRKLLRNHGVKTPESYTTTATQFVVRPLRHYGGVGFRVTTNKEDYNPQTEYIAPLFPKSREYRVIFVFGEPVIMLRKKPGNDVKPDEPWNYSNGSYFQTISSPDECRLYTQTSFFNDAQQFPVIKDAHIVAADVLTCGADYAVCELNFSPAITIHSNLERIKDHVSRVQSL